MAGRGNAQAIPGAHRQDCGSKGVEREGRGAEVAGRAGDAPRDPIRRSQGENGAGCKESSQAITTGQVIKHILENYAGAVVRQMNEASE